MFGHTRRIMFMVIILTFIIGCKRKSQTKVDDPNKTGVWNNTSKKIQNTEMIALVLKGTP